MTQKLQKAARRALRVLQVIEHMDGPHLDIDLRFFLKTHVVNTMKNLQYALKECEQQRTAPGIPMSDEVMEEIIDYAHDMFLNGHYQNFDEALIRETELEHGIGDR